MAVKLPKQFSPLEYGLPLCKTSDVKRIKPIGSGSFGSITLCQMQGKECVLKEPILDGANNIRLFLKEARIMNKTKHPNIITFFSLYKGTEIENYGIVMEYLVFNFEPFDHKFVAHTLRDLLTFIDIHDCKGFEHFVPFVATDVCSGLSYLHDNEIVHRDLKPENILVSNQHLCNTDSSHTLYPFMFDKPIVAKLADFGECRAKLIQTATLVHTKTNNIFRGTPMFMAPEIFFHDGNKRLGLHDLKQMDIWSYSMILFVLLNPDLMYPYQFEYRKEKENGNNRTATEVLKVIFARHELPCNSQKYQNTRSTHWIEIVDTYNRCATFGIRQDMKIILSYLTKKPESREGKAYYQSNYPGGGGGYGGGFGGGYGGGPPPPPGGGYGQPANPGGGYGGGYGNAYNVNASPYGGYGGGYQTGSAPPPGEQHVLQSGYTCYTNINGYGNFTAASNYQSMYVGHQQVAPPPAPPSVYPNGIDSQMASMHQQMQQMMRQQVEMQYGVAKKGRKGKKGRRRRRKRRDDDDEEEEEEDDEDDDEEEDKDEEEGNSGPTEEEIKERVKAIYIAELLRRIDTSGTLDVTSGTVVGYPYYTEDDPVLQFNTEKNGYEFDEDAPLKWDPELDCEYLRDALKGWGINEDAIIHVIATRCNAQRQELKKMFKTAYGRDLIKDLKGDLSFNFETAVLALFVPPAEYDAWAIKEAIYGPGTDERALMEILLTRTNPQIKAIRDCYNDVASPNSQKAKGLIDKDIENDCSGDFKRLLVSAAQGNRSHISEDKLKNAVEEIMSDGTPTGMFEVNFDKLCDIKRAKADAKNLFKAGEDRWGTDEETFVRIFACRDYYQLRATYNEYVKITQRDIENSVSRETSGDFERGLLSIVKNIKCRPRFFADELTSSMKGLGTKDNRLIRIITSRSEIDMVQIKKHFLENNKQTLWKWLQDDCSGDYRKLLQAVVGKD